MRTVYRVLAYLVAAEVAIQAAAVAFGIFGLGKWVEGGGVLDNSSVDGEQTPFPEVVGLVVHGINGTMIVPALALLLLIASFFARVPGGIAWAGGVVVLVAVQVLLGMMGHNIPALGALHGINALLLFAAAFLAARRASARPETGVETAARASATV